VTSTSVANVIIKTVEGKKEADTYHATVRVEFRQARHTADSASLTVAEAADSWIITAEGNGLDNRGQQTHARAHIARGSGA
jgi:integrase